MKKIALSLLLLTSLAFGGDVCTPAPAKEPHLLPCEAPRKLSVRSGIVSCYDSSLGQSVWAASEMDPKSSHSFDRDTCDWKIDKNVGSISPAAYTGTGYAKGHLIAFTDASCASSAADTCVTSNIVPQPGAQNSGVWLQLEKHIRATAAKAPGKKWLVMAGPRFPATMAWVKPGLAQPNGIWKVLINTTDGTGCGYVGAYLKPYAVQVVPVASLGIRGIKDGDPSLCAVK